MDWSSVPGCLVNGVPSLRCIPVLFTNILNVLFMFTGSAAVILIIISGFRYMTSGGDAKQLDSARSTLTYAILGLFLIFFSFLILNIIATITGVSCILSFGPFKDIASNTCAQ